MATTLFIYLSVPITVAHALLRQRLTEIFGNLLELGRHGGLSIFAHDWHPAIPRLARGDVDRNLAEQWDTEPLGLAFPSATSKDLVGPQSIRRWRQMRASTKG